MDGSPVAAGVGVVGAFAKGRGSFLKAVWTCVDDRDLISRKSLPS